MSEISFPIHIFYGTDDQLVPVDDVYHLAEHVSESTLHILEGGGHLFPFSEQKIIFDAIDMICERGIRSERDVWQIPDKTVRHSGMNSLVYHSFFGLISLISGSFPEDKERSLFIFRDSHELVISTNR